jgi:P-type Cu+ transporter
MSDNTKSCYHCGDKLPVVGIVEYDEKKFCCDGCKTVYSLLSESGLDGFYELPEKASVKASSEVNYDYLNNEEILNKLLKFKDERVSKVILNLPAIHCSSCIWLLENLHRINSGIIAVQVNFVRKEANITFKHDQISLKNLAYLLQKIGYPPSFTENNGETSKQNTTDFYIRLGVAGFCFGNIMLFSFPEYLGMEAEYEAYARFFSYLNLLLAIPVLLYSSRSYLVSAYKVVQHKNINIDVPISLGIIALFGRSTYEIVTATGAGYMDSFAGLIFFLLIGKWYQQKTYDALSFERDYKSYFPMAVTKVSKEGEEVHIPIKDINPGDVLLIRNQELIPADSILIKGEARIDYSFVTGESTEVSIQSGEKIFAGGKQKGGLIQVSVLESVEHSYLTSLWNNEAFKKESNKTASAFNRVSKYFTITIVLIAFFTGIYWWLTNPAMTWTTITAILIIACPCALALTLPFTYGNGLRVFGKRHYYLKSGESIEALSGITDIVFDKTGTLTIQGKSKITFVSEKPLTPHEKQLVKSVVRTSAHPLSRQLEAFFNESSELPLEKVEEFPGKGLSATVSANSIRLGSQHWICTKQTEDNRSSVYLEINGELRGFFTFENYYREGVDKLMESLKSLYTLHLLSGDNDSEKQKLTSLFGTSENIHFNQSPQDKLEYINRLKSDKRKVLYLGDGLNDAGALKSADFGIAIAEDIHNFSPSCDAIVKADKIHILKEILTYSGKTNFIIKSSIVVSFVYNVVGLSFAVTGQLTPLVAAILMPLSSVTVVSLITLLSKYYERRVVERGD